VIRASDADRKGVLFGVDARQSLTAQSRSLEIALRQVDIAAVDVEQDTDFLMALSFAAPCDCRGDVTGQPM
jgi:hypothetical protein